MAAEEANKTESAAAAAKAYLDMLVIPANQAWLIAAFKLKRFT